MIRSKPKATRLGRALKVPLIELIALTFEKRCGAGTHLCARVCVCVCFFFFVCVCVCRRASEQPTGPDEPILPILDLISDSGVLALFLR